MFKNLLILDLGYSGVESKIVKKWYIWIWITVDATNYFGQDNWNNDDEDNGSNGKNDDDIFQEDDAFVVWRRNEGSNSYI